MDAVQLSLLALLLGLFTGVAVSLLVVVAVRARDRVRAQTVSTLPEGVVAILDGLEEPAVVVDTSLTVVAASASAGVLGIPVGGSLTSSDLRALARAARSAGGTESATFHIRRPGLNAEERLVSARASIVGPRLTMLVVRDITEHQRIEQMRHDFVANTSHELKTPVGAVSLLSEAIESAADDPKQVRIFALRLQAEAARLAQLTARIMNLSRLQSSDELSMQTDVAIDEVVAASAEAHAVQAASAGVELVRGGDRGLYVRGDAQILIEAVGNLVANAIAYSPQGSRVGIGVKGDADVVEIAVTDQGIGIAEGDQQRVFERFYRADQARSRRTGGSGLGLSIVKHAVQRHGGEVRLWSRPGRGSTFTIRLPRTVPPDLGLPRKRKKPRKPKAAASVPARTTPNGDPR